MRYEAFIVGPSTSVGASGHNVRGTERGRGGLGRGGRDAAAATEQENRMTPVNVRRSGAVDRRLVVLVCGRCARM